MLYLIFIMIAIACVPYILILIGKIKNYLAYNKHIKEFNDNIIKLSYKDMRNYCKINPNNWHYEPYCYFTTIPVITYHPQHNKAYGIILSFFDYCKFKKDYNKYKKNRKKREELDITTQITKQFIEDIQNDINELRAQAEEELKSSSNIYLRISENLFK